MGIWFTADYHLGHANIIEYCRRPFASVAEMDAVILDNLNRAVHPEDCLYMLGDFCMGVGRDQLAAAVAVYRSRIRCRNISLIWGNHDNRQVLDSPGLFTSTHDLLEVNHAGRIFVLCHYAMRVWNKSHGRHSCQLYGHDHGTLPELPGLMSFDVGVDCWDYWPLSVEQVLEVLAHKGSGGRACDLTVCDGRLTTRSK